jgi:hypothetical protein
MKKTSKDGVYRRELSSGDIAYIITYRANNQFYKRKLGTKSEGWTIARAHNERLERSKSFSKVEIAITLEEAFKAYHMSIKQKHDTRNTWGRYYNHIHSEIGNLPLDTINPNHILERGRK